MPLKANFFEAAKLLAQAAGQKSPGASETLKLSSALSGEQKPAKIGAGK